MQSGKRKSVRFGTKRLCLDSSEDRVIQAVCLFFLIPNNRPMQGHVTPGDYDGRFQGSTSMQVDDAAFGCGCWLLLKWLSNKQCSHSVLSEHRRFLPTSPMHGAMNWHSATRTNNRCLDVLSQRVRSRIPSGCQRSNTNSGRIK